MTKKKLKTRSSMLCYKMSDEVQAKIEKIHVESGYPKWLIVEHILEKGLSIKTDNSLDFKQWIKGK